MIVTTSQVPLVLPEGAPRSAGVHLSGIIRCIAKETGILEMEPEEDLSLLDYRAIADPVAIARITMGLAWEEWYIRTQLPEVVDHPGEVELDGIYMTPDGEELTTFIIDRRPRWRLKLSEIKLTYKSINTVCGTKHTKRPWSYWLDHPFNSDEEPIGPMSNQFIWLTQGKGYAKAKGSNYVDFHVLYVCGDYTYPMRPTPLKHSIEFTDDEIDLSWQLTTDYRDSFFRGMAG